MYLEPAFFCFSLVKSETNTAAPWEAQIPSKNELLLYKYPPKSTEANYMKYLHIFAFSGQPASWLHFPFKRVCLEWVLCASSHQTQQVNKANCGNENAHMDVGKIIKETANCHLIHYWFTILHAPEITSKSKRRSDCHFSRVPTKKFINSKAFFFWGGGGGGGFFFFFFSLYQIQKINLTYYQPRDL